MSDSQSMAFSPCRLIGPGGALFVIVGAIVAGGRALAFIHIPSLLFTFGVTFFILLATFEIDFLKFIPQSFLGFHLLRCQTQFKVRGNRTHRFWHAR